MDSQGDFLLVGSPGTRFSLNPPGGGLEIISPPGEAYLYERVGDDLNLQLRVTNNQFPSRYQLGISVAMLENSFALATSTAIDLENRNIEIRLFDRGSPGSESWTEQPPVRIAAPVGFRTTDLAPKLIAHNDAFFISVFNRIHRLSESTAGGWVVSEIIRERENGLPGYSHQAFVVYQNEILIYAARSSGDGPAARIYRYREINDVWQVIQVLSRSAARLAPHIAIRDRWLAVESRDGDVLLFHRNSPDSLFSETPKILAPPPTIRLNSLAFDEGRLLLLTATFPRIQIYEEEAGTLTWKLRETMEAHLTTDCCVSRRLLVVEDGYFIGSGESHTNLGIGTPAYEKRPILFFRKAIGQSYNNWVNDHYSDDEVLQGLSAWERKLARADLNNKQCYLYGLNPRNPDSSKIPQIVLDEEGTPYWQYQLSQGAGDWLPIRQLYSTRFEEWRNIASQDFTRSFDGSNTVYRLRVPENEGSAIVRLRFLSAIK